MGKRNIIRRVYLVDKAGQLKYFGLIVIYVLSYIFFLNLIVYYPIADILYSDEASLAEQEIASKLFFLLETRYLPGLLILTLFLLVHSIYSSNKFFGPIFKIKALLKKVSEGDFSIKCIFRKGDHIKDLQDAFNKMLESLNNRLKEINQTNTSNSLVLSEIASDLTRDEVNKEQIIEKINVVQERIKNINATFKLSP